MNLTPPSIVTIGIFDGVHLGHQAMLHALLQEAQKEGLRSVVLTFKPHPRTILSGNPYPLLQTPSEKEAKLLAFGVDEVFWIEFTPNFAQMLPETFVEEVLVQQLNAKKIMIGYDHKFGKNRLGNFNLLQTLGQKFGFETVEMPAVLLAEAVVSSSRIRQLLATHQLGEVNQLLGAPYTFHGVVVHGEKRGRTIGFPTANLSVQSQKIIPADGVYAVTATLNEKKYHGMMNVGKRPTFEAEKTIEVHIFDFDADIYGEVLEIACIDFIRPVVKFSGINALIEQLKKDEKACRNRLVIND